MLFPRLPFALVTLAAAAAALGMTSTSHAQAPQLPPPEATHPVPLQLMQGFPPPPDKIVRLANILKYPNVRWAAQAQPALGSDVPDPILDPKRPELTFMHNQVSFRLLIRAGAANDAATKPGVASFVAALLDQGTSTMSAEVVANTIESAGGILSVGAGNEVTFVSGAVVKEVIPSSAKSHSFQ